MKATIQRLFNTRFYDQHTPIPKKHGLIYNDCIRGNIHNPNTIKTLTINHITYKNTICVESFILRELHNVKTLILWKAIKFSNDENFKFFDTVETLIISEGCEMKFIKRFKKIKMIVLYEMYPEFIHDIVDIGIEILVVYCNISSERTSVRLIERLMTMIIPICKHVKIYVVLGKWNKFPYTIDRSLEKYKLIISETVDISRIKCMIHSGFLVDSHSRLCCRIHELFTDEDKPKYGKLFKSYQLFCFILIR